MSCWRFSTWIEVTIHCSMVGWSELRSEIWGKGCKTQLPSSAKLQIQSLQRVVPLLAGTETPSRGLLRPQSEDKKFKLQSMSRPWSAKCESSIHLTCNGHPPGTLRTLSQSKPQSMRTSHQKSNPEHKPCGMASSMLHSHCSAGLFLSCCFRHLSIFHFLCLAVGSFLQSTKMSEWFPRIACQWQHISCIYLDLLAKVLHHPKERPLTGRQDITLTWHTTFWTTARPSLATSSSCQSRTVNSKYLRLFDWGHRRINRIFMNL